MPDPQDAQSFELSKLSPREPEQLYVDLLRLRRELPPELEVAVDEDCADARAPARPGDPEGGLRR